MGYEEEIMKVMEDCSNEVIEVICNRLKLMEDLTESEATKMANLSRTKDLKEIEDIISKRINMAGDVVDKAVEKAAEENDMLAAQYYKAGNVIQDTVNNSVLNAIKRTAAKSMKDGILNLSHTTAFQINGNLTTLKMAYVNAVNRGIYALHQGYTDYNTAIRGIVSQLAESGLRVVEYDTIMPNGKPLTRRMDSAVRMNVMEGVRRMNEEYRRQQGEEFGADGVEISVHYLCAPDHQLIQGRQFSYEDFDNLQSTLQRPIGHLNCRHTIFPIILGISEPNYTQKELKAAKDNSNRMVTYTDKNGDQKTCTLYEASQKQREQETIIRKLKDKREAYRAAGDEMMFKEMNLRINKANDYYTDLSEEIGLSAKFNRLSVQNIIEKAETDAIITVVGDDDVIRYISDKKLKAKIIREAIAAPSPVYDEKLRMAYKRVKPKDGCYDICMHGTSKSVEYEKKYAFDAKTLFLVISGRRDFKPEFDNVRLLSCSTGKKTETGYCLAQELANRLGVDVYAPIDDLTIEPDGTLHIGPGKLSEEEGFKWYKATKKKRNKR